MWKQKTIQLNPARRGFHLITRDLLAQLPELADYKIGLAHFFIQHTSASISINENADPEVRTDLQSHFNILAPENAPYYEHTYEGSDDMPAHMKTMLIGNWITVPITNGRLNLASWQGIYLCEHRNNASGRRIIVTLQGEIR